MTTKTKDVFLHFLTHISRLRCEKKN